MEKDAEHFKCSASQAVGLIPIIAFFLERALPAGTLDAAVQCFLLLHRILDQLASVPRHAVDSTVLQENLSAYVLTYRALYGAEKIKPKFHAALHFAYFLRKHGMLVSCWTHERRHKRLKRAANDIYNTRTFEHSVLGDSTAQHIHDVCSNDYEFAVGLVKPRRASKREAQLLTAAFCLQAEFFISVAVRISCWDVVHVDDVVLFKDADNNSAVCAGKLTMNVSVNGNIFCIIEVLPLRQWCGGHATWAAHGSRVVVRVTDVMDAVTWRESGETVTTLIPLQFRKCR